MARSYIFRWYFLIRGKAFKKIEISYATVLKVILMKYYEKFHEYQQYICDLMDQGIIDLLIFPNIVNYFVWEKLEPIKKYSENAVYSYFLAGHFCIVRGHYSFKIFLPDEDELDDMFPFWDLEDSPFIVKEIKGNKEVLFLNLNKFIEIRALQKMERFVFGRTLTLAFAVSDGKERPFACQRWVHSFKLELFWAITPSFIIILVIIPSLILLYSSDVIKYCDHSVRVTANQWFWNYAASNINVSKYYNSFIFDFSTTNFRKFNTLDNVIPFLKNKDEIIFTNADDFDSYLLSDFDLTKGLKRLLDTDRHLITPSFSALRFIVSSIDVLHSFSLPSAGIKIDAVTGRLNCATIFLAKDGVLTGQCSELCGSGHYGMPIVLETMCPFDFRSYLEYNFWIESNMSGYCPLLTIDDKATIDFSNLKDKNLLEANNDKNGNDKNSLLLDGNMNTISS